MVATSVAPKEATSDVCSASPACERPANAVWGVIASRTVATGPVTIASNRKAATGKSGPGIGRTIIESLPKHHRIGEAGGPGTRMAAPMVQRNWRVLIADDDPAICTLIDTVLR